MPRWSTLAELDAEEPCKDYDEVAGLLESDYDSSEDLKCWRIEIVPVEEITRLQILDDPDAHDSHAKVSKLRLALRQNARLPPLALIHHAQAKGWSYFLLDGCHRFNAAHLERIEGIRAWVGHIGCCEGPSPDLHAEG